MEKRFEELLIKHCSPVLGRIKTANLFCFPSSNAEKIDDLIHNWNLKLNKYDITIKKIKVCSKGYCLIYVFRRALLYKDLQKEGVLQYLIENDYPNHINIDKMLNNLSKRLSMYNDFPHEIGLFLGYPLDDVIGFVRNKGKNFCCSGYWKVYNNENEAQKYFKRFKKCTSIYQQLYKNGKSVLDLTVAA